MERTHSTSRSTPGVASLATTRKTGLHPTKTLFRALLRREPHEYSRLRRPLLRGGALRELREAAVHASASSSLSVYGRFSVRECDPWRRGGLAGRFRGTALAVTFRPSANTLLTPAPTRRDCSVPDDAGTLPRRLWVQKLTYGVSCGRQLAFTRHLGILRLGTAGARDTVHRHRFTAGCVRTPLAVSSLIAEALERAARAQAARRNPRQAIAILFVASRAAAECAGFRSGWCSER